ncbi:RNA polymerase sigma factor [Geodermatophilus sp. SYSU D01180]
MATIEGARVSGGAWGEGVGPGEERAAFDEARFVEKTGMQLEDAIVVVRRALRRYYGNEYDADDATQETLLALERRAGKPPGHDPRAWVYASAVNMAKDRTEGEVTHRTYQEKYGRLTSRDREHSESASDAGSSAVRRLESADVEAVMEAAISRLPEKQQEMLRLCYDSRTGDFNARSEAELAAELGVPPGTVKSRKNAGMRALRKILEDFRDQLGEGEDVA